MDIISKNPTPKKPNIYTCEQCNYKTSNKKDYGRHLLTRKHTMELNGNCMETQKPQVLHVCSRCNKEYATKSGLWKHEKKCVYPNETL